ncbi:Nacht and wd40 domain [Pyrenophora seminiperda CCB06]|uniref:Nacht and wd40 domain n=1 Tax=Pyrenophora seminiperda CCB06 TaxID=1302712 RepID=A0A3M7LZQ5_9PLEO|nr:Nacht and wd40 domain [Pyrenophora seminiperda CCB06]
MSTTHNLHISHPIPPSISPSSVIAALHDHSTALTLQALTTSHTKAPSTPPATLRDTYWYPPDQYPLTTYNVTECITFCPGIGAYGRKYITFPSSFQDTRTGIKTRADAAAGVTVRAEFRVVRSGVGGYGGWGWGWGCWCWWCWCGRGGGVGAGRGCGGELFVVVDAVCQGQVGRGA